MRKYTINEAIVEDKDLAEKIKRFAELSDKIDEIKNNLNTLKSEYDDIEVHLRPILEQLNNTKDKALQVEKILVTIKRKGYERENVSYKDAFNWLYSKVNSQMKAIIDEALEKNKTLTKIASSIGVQKLSENKLKKSLTSAVGKITSLLKPFISFLSKKNQEIEKTISDFKSKFKINAELNENLTKTKKIGLNQFKNLVKRIIKEEKNNLTTRKNKVVRITESQLRNQVRRMLREYDEERYVSEEGSINIDPLPNGDVLDVDFNIEPSNNNEPSWTITRAYLYTDNGDGEIDIYKPKYANILKIVEKRIHEYMKDNGWYKDNLSSDDYWPERPYSSRLREKHEKDVKRI